MPKIEKLLQRYLKYLIRSRTRYKVHSPFVFKMINEVFRKKSDLSYLKNYISRLKNDETVIEITDYGAGSRKNKTNKRKIQEIYKTSSSKPKKADLIKRICEYEFEFFKILELGTNLGVTTFALSQSPKSKEIKTIEGCPNLYLYAKVKLESQSKIEQINGKFDDHLKSQLENFQPNIVYIDGNHTYEATIRYFNLIHTYSFVELIIFDDVHWSKGMNQAWSEIIESKDFHVSIDLFQLGLLFRREEQIKEHFILRY